MQVWSVGQEDPLEEEMATHSSVLAWRIPWTVEPGGLQCTGSQRVTHFWSNLALAHLEKDSNKFVLKGLSFTYTENLTLQSQEKLTCLLLTLYPYGTCYSLPTFLSVFQHYRCWLFFLIILRVICFIFLLSVALMLCFCSHAHISCSVIVHLQCPTEHLPLGCPEPVGTPVLLPVS